MTLLLAVHGGAQLGVLARLLQYVWLAQAVTGLSISLWAMVSTLSDYRLKRRQLRARPDFDPAQLDDYRDVADQSMSQAGGGLLLHLIGVLLGLIAVASQPPPGRELVSAVFALGFNALQFGAITLQLRVHRVRHRMQARILARVRLTALPDHEQEAP